MRKILAGLAVTAATLATLSVPAAASPVAAAGAATAEAAATLAAQAAVNAWPKPGKGRDGHPKGMPNVPLLEAAKKGQRLQAAAIPDPSYVYHYGSTWEFESNLTGVSAGIKLFNNGYLNSYDVHTLAEIAYQSASGDQTVEVGWGKGGWCSSSTVPCLFVYHWVDDTPTCYHTCGFSNWGSALDPGDPLDSTMRQGCATGSARNERFSIRRDDVSGDYMINVDLCYGDAVAGEWIGEFSASNWASSTEPGWTGGLTQIYGETVTEYDTSVAQHDGYFCSDMGPGGLATANNGPYPANGQRIGDVVYTGAPAKTLSDVNMNVSASTHADLQADVPGAYAAVPITGTPRYFNIGGPGWSGAIGNTKPGVSGGC